VFAGENRFAKGIKIIKGEATEGITREAIVVA